MMLARLEDLQASYEIRSIPCFSLDLPDQTLVLGLVLARRLGPELWSGFGFGIGFVLALRLGLRLGPGLELGASPFI